MLKSHICVVCEKVIIEYQSGPDGAPIQGPTTLINLFQKITAIVPANAPDIPANSLIPKDWSIYGTWNADSTEAGNYEVCMQIFYPDGTKFGESARTSLKTEPNKRAQAIFKVLGFPIGQAGFYTIRMWIEANGEIIVAPMEETVEVEINKQAKLEVVQLV